MKRRLAAYATVVALLWPAASLAQQSDLGQIRIAVTDAASKAPVALARVLLSGPIITSELSGSNGQVLFTDVPDGIYRARVFKRGYEGVTSPQFEVIEGRSVLVSVELGVSSALPVIGRVVVHSSAVVSADTLTENSAQRRLSSDLADALNKLSGVSVTTSSDDSDATQTISLEGHDPTQTAMTLDGIPLNGPGTAGDLRSFASDLFTGASVHMGPQIGGLGGGVNFTTLEPTLSWLSYASYALGSYGRYNYALAETGSDGKLGIAAEVTDRNTPSLVDGLRYLDASGLDYVHDGDSSIGGELLKLHYALSDTQTLVGTFLGSTVDTGLVCLRIDGSLPCGYGPNNGTQSNFDLYALTDDALFGATALQASFFGMDSKRFENELNRFVDGLASPNGFATSSTTHGFSINATLPAQQRHTLSVQAYDLFTDEANVPIVPQSVPYYSGASQSSYGALQLSDTIHSSDKLTLLGSFGLSHASYAPAGVLGTAAVTWHPSAHDTYSLSYALSGTAVGGPRQTTLTDPDSLRFDCAGNVAYGSAPGDQGGSSSSSSVRVGYTHTIFGGNVSLSLYRQVQNDVLLPVDVNGSVLQTLGVVPPSYPSLVEPIWDSPAGCNAPPGTPFGATQLYFSTRITGTQHVYEGVELTSYLTFGDLVVQPYYNITGSVVYSTDPRIDNPYSFVISGVQAPNVPLHRAGVVFDYKAPRSAFEYLFDAQYTGSNNPSDLPSYVTFDAGVSAQLEHGTLTVAASNITNQFGGVFASPQWEVPYTTAGGAIVPNIARPLTPREYQVTYAVRFGQGAQQLAPATSFREPRGGRRNGFYGGPGGGGAERRGFRSLLSPLPSEPPAEPFAVTRDPQTCSADALGYAQTLSTALSAYAQRVESAKSAAGYPATMAPVDLPDATVTYHGLGTTYAFTITPKAGRPLRGILGCLTIHIARSDDIASHHLYAPENALLFVPQLHFMPAVGLYLAARAQTAGQESFRVYVLPSSAPRSPFEVRTGGACSGDAQSIAAQMLGELRGYFTKGARAPSWTIAPHTGASGTWYELEPDDPSTIGALLVCGRVATATAQELAQRGWAGAPIPALNYSRALGIYLVRREVRRTSPTASPQPSPVPSPP
ncbi:MAG: TonB-dependent receptor plug domain-containing protein [Candidatus Tyrphobacter sp.]